MTFLWFMAWICLAGMALNGIVAFKEINKAIAKSDAPYYKSEIHPLSRHRDT